VTLAALVQWPLLFGCCCPWPGLAWLLLELLALAGLARWHCWVWLAGFEWSGLLELHASLEFDSDSRLR
jgi:hypothetical protein